MHQKAKHRVVHDISKSMPAKVAEGGAFSTPSSAVLTKMRGNFYPNTDIIMVQKAKKDPFSHISMTKRLDRTALQKL